MGELRSISVCVSIRASGFWVEIRTQDICVWEWVITEIPVGTKEVTFGRGAFTRPKVIEWRRRGLRSYYTYFAWRDTKWELTNFTELTQSSVLREYFRPTEPLDEHD